MDHEPPQHNPTVFKPGDPINPLRKTHQSGSKDSRRIDYVVVGLLERKASGPRTDELTDIDH